MLNIDKNKNKEFSFNSGRFIVEMLLFNLKERVGVQYFSDI